MIDPSGYRSVECPDCEGTGRDWHDYSDCEYCYGTGAIEADDWSDEDFEGQEEE